MQERLPPTVEKALEDFVRNLNVNCPHPLDEQRFYEFVILARRRRCRANDGEVRRFLEEAGLRPDNATYWANVYAHGRDLLDYAAKYGEICRRRERRENDGSR